MKFRDALKQQVIVLDGAMGTQIQALDLTDADFGGVEFKMLSDLLVFSKPEAVRDIHLNYYKAGANGVETNTFGASPFRLCEYDFSGLDLGGFAPIPYGIDLQAVSYEEMAYYLSRRAAELAVEARDLYRKDKQYDGRPLFVVGSIGPSNRVISSTDADLKTATFDEIAGNFYHQVRGLVEGGADVLLYETQQDVLELKAAVMGGQRAMADLGRQVPIMAQVTVDAFSKMQIFNTDIQAALVTLQGIGIDVFGMNCSIGPDLMEKSVEKLSKCSPLPISVLPNAGLPESEDGRTVFKLSPESLAEYLEKFVKDYGVGVVGGCCGTTPDHIKAIAEAVRGVEPRKRQVTPAKYLSGPQEPVLVDSSEGLIRIGERLNVRGSLKVREAVENEGSIDQEVLEEVVHEQVDDLGLSIIDVCMDSNVVDTADTLAAVVHQQTTDFPGAMCIDSFAVDALTEAIKWYPGRPLINSISMEEASEGVLKVDAVLEATKQHWPMYVGLATGPKGPGATRKEKADLARQIVDRCAEHGVLPEQLLIDMNVFPIGSESEEGMNFAVESIEAIPLIKAIHPDLLTVCGVGNLTNGLAQKPYMRKVLTSVWIDEARKKGLDAAIINPNHYVPVETIDKRDHELALKIIFDRDMDAFGELEDIAEEKKGVTVTRRTTYDDLPLEEAICEKVKDGFKQREHGAVDVDGHTYKFADKIVLQVAEAIKTHEPLDFINQYLMKAMNELGEGFARGEVSLPHLLKSADVMKQVMGFLEDYMRVLTGRDVHDEIEYKGTIVIGTVYQDVHSIGKDLARTLFDNYGYRTIDLGVMTPLQKYLDTAKEHNADAIGMSALLVQTSNHMITVARMMEEQGMDLPLLIGGAPVNDRHAAYVSMKGQEDTAKILPGVFYCPTAMDGVNTMNRLMGQERPALLDANKDRLIKNYARATKRAEEKEELLRTLPRREISFDEHRVPADAWLPYETLNLPLKEFSEHIDKKTLYALNWKFGGTSSRIKQGETPEKLEELFNEWIDRADREAWIRPMGVMAVLPCQSNGDEVIVYDPEDMSKERCRFKFDVVVGGGRKDTICAAQYFRPKDSGEIDAIGVQICTSGPQVDHFINGFREDGDSESCLYLQGLSDRIAEDMADYMHAKLRSRLNLNGKTGARWSPGYPAITDTSYNETILSLLHASDLIGINITDAGEFSPTGTTAALVCFHSDARYT